MPGEGSIYRRSSDGRWVAAISLGPRGARVSHVRYGRTRAEARSALESLRESLDEHRPSATMTTGAYLRLWLDDTARPSIRANTYRGYDVVVRTHLGPLNDIPLGDLTPEDIEATLNAIDRSAKTVRNAQLMLRAALRVAEERGYVRRNVARMVPLRRLPKRTEEPLAPTLAKAIRSAMASDRYAAAVDLALCGLRQGEVLGLTWSELDLAAGFASIRYELTRVDGRYRRDEVKSASSAAPVPLPAFVVASLTEHRRVQLAERMAAGVPTEDGLVFLTERGRPVNGSWFTKHFQQRLAEAGLPRMRLHDLRHGAASLLVAGGAPPRVVQEYLRHANARTTMEIYAHVSGAQRREAADLLEAMIG